ncbi:MAG: hypothetical protein ACK5Q5_01015 [Planctomycetaceae bacterium]
MQQPPPSGVDLIAEFEVPLAGPSASLLTRPPRRTWLKAGRAAELLQHTTYNEFSLAP